MASAFKQALLVAISNPPREGPLQGHFSPDQMVCCVDQLVTVLFIRLDPVVHIKPYRACTPACVSQCRQCLGRPPPLWWTRSGELSYGMALMHAYVHMFMDAAVSVGQCVASVIKVTVLPVVVWLTSWCECCNMPSACALKLRNAGCSRAGCCG